ncbi:MAG: SRPBCC family protein [Chloroflexota bacterium]|nr:SRPBCC family protein [Chloroflexota bacterium]
MAQVRDQFRVNAPADRVWAVAIDANRIPEWQTNVVEVKDVSGPLDQVGARYSARNRLAGRPIEGEWEVTRAEPNRLLELKGTAPGGGRALNTVTFTQTDGATDVAVEFDYELPGGFLGQFANRLFVERALQRDVRHSGENFKALCEETDAA